MSNITADKKNNIIKMTVSRYDYTKGSNPLNSRRTDTFTITIPDGYYDKTELLAIINAATDPDITTYQYRFGSGALPTTYPALYSLSSNKKLIIAQYTDLLTQINTPLATNTGVYEYFELTVDSQTLGLLQVLGFQLNTNTTVPSYVERIYCQPYIPQGTPTTTAYTMTNSLSNTTAPIFNGLSGNGMYAPLFYNVNTTTSLFLSLENAISQNRSTYYALSKTDFMYRIPVNCQFGEQIIWQATLDNPSFQPNFNLSQLRITICDQNGVNVDFQGVNWTADVKIDWANNVDTPQNSASQMNMHLMNNRTFDPKTVAQPLSANYDRLFPARADAGTKRPRKFIANG